MIYEQVKYLTTDMYHAQNSAVDICASGYIGREWCACPSDPPSSTFSYLKVYFSLAASTNTKNQTVAERPSVLFDNNVQLLRYNPGMRLCL